MIEETTDSDDASPRRFLLALLHAFMTDVPVQLLIRAASLFEIDENRTRVALHRLRTKGRITSSERGSYRIGDSDFVLNDALRWRETLHRTVPWEGRWVFIHTSPLPRADKTVARRRDRATSVHGFRELLSGLLVRPDNLAGGVDALRRRMQSVGLEAEALIARADALGPHDATARTLWHELDLDSRYRAHIARLELTIKELPLLDPEEGARRTFVIGGRAISDIVLDPLLPSPLVDESLREAFIEAMIAFDHVGRQAWAAVLETDLALRQAPAADLP